MSEEKSLLVDSIDNKGAIGVFQVVAHDNCPLQEASHGVHSRSARPSCPALSGLITLDGEGRAAPATTLMTHRRVAGWRHRVSICPVSMPLPPAMKPARWTHLGSYEIYGSVCPWTCEVAIRPEADGLWSVRWRGEEQNEVVLGPDHLDSLAELLVEEYNLEREDLLAMFASCGIGFVEEFARRNMV